MKFLISLSLLSLLFIQDAIAAPLTFRNKFIELATNDATLDKTEYNYLKKLALDPSIPDKEFANDTLNNLGKYSDRITLEYTLQTGHTSQQTITFSFTPSYTETESIPGKNVFDIVSNISQKDSLSETQSDEDRCAAASLVNSYLLMGGTFASLANKFGVENKLTYKNVHLIQEKIYKIANSDNSPGIYSGYKYKSYSDGKVFDIVATGEILNAVNYMKIKLTPLLGSNLSTLHQRKKQVIDFFKRNPKGVIQVGVFLDLKSGELKAPYSDNEQNHVVTVFKMNNKFYMNDTSSVNNGGGKNIRALTDNGMEYFVYNTSAIINGLTM